MGNELFVVVQQDIRRIEDIRQISYNRVLSSHHILPMFTQLNANVFGTCAPTTQSFIPFISPSPQQNTSIFSAAPPCGLNDVDMEKQPSQIVANVSKQIFWSKQSKSTSPYPIRYSITTSTTELQEKKPIDSGKNAEDKKHCSCQTWCKPIGTSCNRETQTNAQAKNEGESTNPEKNRSTQSLQKKISEQPLPKQRNP